MNRQITWFRNAVIYHILIDRFNGMPEQNLKYWDKPVFFGGTIAGIAAKLAYLKDLGINTLWLSPFCSSLDYHGYHVTDYFKINPRFGCPEDLAKLISKAHAQGIRSSFSRAISLTPIGKSIPIGKASGKIAATAINARCASGRERVLEKRGSDSQKKPRPMAPISATIR